MWLDDQQVTFESNIHCSETVHAEAGKAALRKVKLERSLTAGEKNEGSAARCLSQSRTLVQ